MFSFFSDCSEEILRELPDEAVLAHALSHPSSFAELVRRYEAAFLRKARSILHSEEEAEDAVQEAFMRIYRYGERYTEVPGATFKSWAYRILLNVVFTRYGRLKHARERSAVLSVEQYEILPDTESQQFEQKELREYLVSVFARMPDAFAETLKLYFLEGLSQREIADRVGVSEGAIKTRMHRAKVAFRQAVDSMR